jgi:DNA polymerase-3 subunit delta
MLMATHELYFFTGENDYALERELLRWKKAFQSKHGDENLLTLVGKDTTLSELLDAVSVLPFIAEKRLVLIRGLPKIDRDECKTLVDNIHPQTIVVFAESLPDKRLSIVKELMAVCQVKQYAPLSPRELFSWIAETARQSGSFIAPAAATLLLEIVGNNQWMLESEIHKLSAYAAGREIVQKDVMELAVPAGEQVVWRLTDLIGNRKIDDAIRFLQYSTERGEDPYALWVILLSMVKNVALVWAGLNEGLRDERSISGAFGIHFLQVRGLLPLAKSLSAERMKDLVDSAAEADLAMKTGGHSFTAERPHELLALTERLMLKCA